MECLVFRRKPAGRRKEWTRGRLSCIIIRVELSGVVDTTGPLHALVVALHDVPAKILATTATQPHEPLVRRRSNMKCALVLVVLALAADVRADVILRGRPVLIRVSGPPVVQPQAPPVEVQPPP